MALPTFIAGGYGWDGSATTGAQIGPMPAGVTDGDILVVFFMTGGGVMIVEDQALTTASSGNELFGRQAILYKMLSVAEQGATYVINIDFESTYGFAWAVYRNVAGLAVADVDLVDGSTSAPFPVVNASGDIGLWGLASVGSDYFSSDLIDAPAGTQRVLSDVSDRLQALWEFGHSGGNTPTDSVGFGDSLRVTVGTVVLTGTNDPPNAPLVSDQGVFNRAEVNRVVWQHSDPDLGDGQSAAEVVVDPGGVGTLVSIPNPNQFWDSPAGTWVADVTECKVRTADQDGEWGPYSTFFVTAADAPPGATWLDPTNGQTISGSTYTGVVSVADVDRSEWRLVADNAGAIDEATVLAGPVLKATGDVRSHSFDGLANGVTVWWQVRVEFEGLWSGWVSVRTPISYTPPPTPTVTYSIPTDVNGKPLPMVDVHIVNPAPTGDQPAVSYNDVYVTDPGEVEERRARFVARNGTWRYHTPPKGFDPATSVRVVAVGENGTTATSTPDTIVEVPDVIGGGDASTTQFANTIGGGTA